MTRQLLIEGSMSRGKTLRQKLKALQLFDEGKTISIYQPNKEWLVLDPEKMNYDDVADMLGLSIANMIKHTCPNCGHKYPDYSYYGNNGDIFLFCMILPNQG